MEIAEQLEKEIEELKVKATAIKKDLKNVEKEILKRKKAISSLKGWGVKKSKKDKDE